MCLALLRCRSLQPFGSHVEDTHPRRLERGEYVSAHGPPRKSHFEEATLLADGLIRQSLPREHVLCVCRGQTRYIAVLTPLPFSTYKYIDKIPVNLLARGDINFEYILHLPYRWLYEFRESKIKRKCVLFKEKEFYA